MKNKMLLRFLCLVLTLCLTAAPLFSVVGSAAGYEKDCPYIYVHGFMGSDVYVDPDDPDSDVVWPPSTNSILTAVKNSLPALTKFVITHDYDALGDAVIPEVTAMFAPCFNDPDGTAGGKSGVRFEYPAADTVTPDGEYDFIYDWRIDPIEVAGQLDEFIDYIRQCSGCEQVVLEGHSFGGVILNTYACLYGEKNAVRSYAFNSTAVFGETYTGELMTGQMKLDADALTEYLKSVMDYNDFEKLLDGIFQLLNDANITDAICKLGNKIIEKIGDRACAESVVPMFGGWLSIWAMVPDEYIEEAQDYVFNTIYKDSTVDRSGLIEKIDDYNARVRVNKVQTLKDIDENANLYVVARYGYSSMFITPSWRNNSDTVIDAKYASFGAAACDYNKTFSDEETAGADEAYISPNRQINAAGCMFPEQTWFVRSFPHSLWCEDFKTFVKTLLYYDGQATVDTFEEYPRFLVYGMNGDTVQKDTAAPQKLTFFQRLRNFFAEIIAKLKTIFHPVMFLK